jgi:ABC-type uncharacterized transport system involved in gliding motility auxiliary subunit
MKNSKFQTLIFSTAGVALVFIAIVGANLIFSPVRARVDLTADRLHTLSDGTKAILAKLDAPIQVRLYVSQGKERMPSAIQPYVQRVEDLLAEFKAQAKGSRPFATRCWCQRSKGLAKTFGNSAANSGTPGLKWS